MLALWDYLLALIVLTSVMALVWLLVGPRDVTALPADMLGLDEPFDGMEPATLRRARPVARGHGHGGDRLSA